MRWTESRRRNVDRWAPRALFAFSALFVFASVRDVVASFDAEAPSQRDASVFAFERTAAGFAANPARTRWDYRRPFWREFLEARLRGERSGLVRQPPVPPPPPPLRPPALADSAELVSAFEGADGAGAAVHVRYGPDVLTAVPLEALAPYDWASSGVANPRAVLPRWKGRRFRQSLRIGDTLWPPFDRFRLTAVDAAGRTAVFETAAGERCELAADELGMPRASKVSPFQSGDFVPLGTPWRK